MWHRLRGPCASQHAGPQGCAPVCLQHTGLTASVVAVDLCSQGEPGDLYVFISVKPHPELRREGVTIHSGAAAGWCRRCILLRPGTSACCMPCVHVAEPRPPRRCPCRCGDFVRGCHPGHHCEGDHARNQRAVGGGPQDSSRWGRGCSGGTLASRFASCVARRPARCSSCSIALRPGSAAQQAPCCACRHMPPPLTGPRQAGTQPGTTLVMSKRGVPKLGSNARGDHLVHVKVGRRWTTRGGMASAGLVGQLRGSGCCYFAG